MAKKNSEKEQATEEKARNTGDKKLNGPNRPST
ncbi:spore protein [Metabacillus niabensis]